MPQPRLSLTPERIGGLVALTASLQLLFSTIAGSVVNVWGPPASDLLFRIVVATQFLSGLGGLVLSVGLLVVAGALVPNRRGLIVVSAFSFGLIVVAILLVVSLGLDYLQFRSGIPPDSVGDWDLTIGSAVFFALSSVPVFGLLGAAAYSCVPRTQRPRQASPLLAVGNRG